MCEFFLLIAAYFIIGVIAVLGYILRKCYVKKKNNRLRDTMLQHDFISLDNFERNWIASRRIIKTHKGSIGYKYNDRSGCYIILIFGETPNGKFGNYEHHYIGQSQQMCQRVHDHANGHGNGDVYADRKSGKLMYVCFVPCPEEAMNDMEKALIKIFGLKHSYNKTRGGSKKR